MSRYFPHGQKLPALERNILKYRAFEMVLILFHISELRQLVLPSIQATDELQSRSSGNHQMRIPMNAKDKYKKAWGILVSEGIISKAESDDIQRLMDYRNHIAHSIHELTSDLSRHPAAEDCVAFSSVKYDYEALPRLKHYRRKIEKGMMRKFVISLDLPSFFEAAEKTYEDERQRLAKKIDRQISIRTVKNKQLKTEFTVAKHRARDIDPLHPQNIGRNGTLTQSGIGVCYKLYEMNLSPLTVAYLMRISYRAAKKRYEMWSK